MKVKAGQKGQEGQEADQEGGKMMEKDLVIEISKRKMAHIYFRKRICRCLASKVISLARLALGIPGTNQRYEEYQIYLDELSKVSSKLKEKETLVFDEMIAAGVKAIEIDDIMRKIESYPVDENAIYQAYPIAIDLRCPSLQDRIEENKRRIWSIGYDL